MKSYFQHLFAYERWANERVLIYLETESPHRQMLDIFGHLIAEMTPWLYLLRGETVPADIDCSPHWSIAECRSHLFALQDSLDHFIEGLDDTDFSRDVISPGPKGRIFHHTVAEVLTHLLSHGQHHRGQIEWIVTQETGTYLPTSYMPYLRR